MKKLHRLNIYIVGLISLLCIHIGIHLPFFHLYPAGDTVAYLNGPLEMYDNNLNPFVEFFSYKPPFQFLLVAILFKIFGLQSVVVNSIVFFFSLLMLFGTFLLGTTIYNQRVGFFATVLLFFTPLFLGQSFMYTDAVFTGTGLVFSFLFFVKKRRLPYFIATSILVLTKEPYVFIPVFQCLYTWFSNRNLPIWKRFKTSVFFLSPILLFILWMIGNKVTLGWFLWPTNASMYNTFSWQKLIWATQQFFYHDAMWLIIPSAWMGYILLLLQKKTRKTNTYVFMFFLITVFYIFFFSGPYFQRYMLPLYSLIFVAFCVIFESLIKTNATTYIYIFLVLTLCVTNIYVYKKDSSLWLCDDSLTVLPCAYLQQQAVKYVTTKYPNYLYATTQAYDPAFDPVTGIYIPKLAQGRYWDCDNSRTAEEQILTLKESIENDSLSGLLLVGPYNNQPCETLPTEKQLLTTIYIHTIFHTYYQSIYNIPLDTH